MITKTPARGRDEIRLIGPPEGVQWFNFDPGHPALSHPFRHALAGDSKAKAWKVMSPTLGVAIEVLSTHKVGAKNGRAFVFADMPDGPRKKDRISAVTAVGLDLDDGALTGRELDGRIAAQGWLAVRYSTHSHRPDHPKHRIVIFLAEPFDLLTAGDGDHRRGCEAWSRIPLAVGAILGVEIDRACLDPSRAFYTPRHPRDAQWEVSVFGGDLLDVTTLELPPLSRTPSRKSPVTGNGRDLLLWAKNRSAGFQIADAIETHADERIRSRDGAKLTVECPFDDHHSNPGDPDDAGFFVCNAGEGKGVGFTAFCSHHHCQNRDRLDYVGEMIRAGWLPDSILTDPDYYPLSDEPAAAVEPDLDTLINALSPESSDAAVEEAVHVVLMNAGNPLAESRLMERIRMAVGLTASPFTKLISLIRTGGRARGQAPAGAKLSAQEAAALTALYPAPPDDEGTRYTWRTYAGRPWLHGDSGSGAKRLWTPWTIEGGTVAVDDGARAGVRLSAQNGDGFQVSFTVEAPDFFNHGGLPFKVALRNAGVALSEAGEFDAVRWVRESVPAAPTRIYKRPGWRDGAFLSPWGTAIGGNFPIEIDPETVPQGDELAGTLDGWREGARAALESDVLHFATGVLAGLASPILDLCELPTSFVAYTGLTGQGKSTAQQIQASAWGDPQEGKGLLRPINASEIGFEILMQRHSGVGLAFEDYKLLAAHLLQHLVFVAASSTGRTRGTRNDSLRGLRTWRLLITLSGEMSLADKIGGAGEEVAGGLSARALDLDVGAEPQIGADALERIGAIKQNFGHAGPAFVRALFDQGHAADPAGLAGDIEAKAKALAGEGATSQLLRPARIVAVIWATGEIAQRANLIPGDYDLQMLASRIWARAQEAETAGGSTHSRALETLYRNLYARRGGDVHETLQGEYREAKAWRLEPDAKPGKLHQAAVRKVDGRAVYDALYVVPLAALAELSGGSVGHKAVVRALADADALVPQPRGENLERIWDYVPGLAKMRAVVIRVPAVEGEDTAGA